MRSSRTFGQLARSIQLKAALKSLADLNGVSQPSFQVPMRFHLLTPGLCHCQSVSQQPRLPPLPIASEHAEYGDNLRTE